MYPDGSSILGGHTYGDWSTTNAGWLDFMVVKLDVDGSVLWEWQVRMISIDRNFSHSYEHPLRMTGRQIRSIYSK